MKLNINKPPHIRAKDSNRTIMGDAIIALFPVYCLAVYYYGTRAIYLAVISVLTCCILDMLSVLMAGRKLALRDYSPIITGLIIPLLMPASVDIKIVIVAAVFAIIVTKQPFGGIGENIFNPAAAGVAFTIICWPKIMFAYPIPLNPLPMENIVDTKFIPTTAHILKLGGIPGTNYMDMLLGNFAGAMGTTCILVLIACYIYLLTRGSASIYLTTSYLVTCGAIALLFPRNDMHSLQSVAYELMSGSLLFGGVFLLNDPVTSPKRDLSRIIYGAFTGVLVMLFRRFGSFDEGTVFAILFSNSFVWMIDIFSEKYKRTARGKYKLENRKA